MTEGDVRTQIAAALGGTLRLERELVGGGMSRVFVAHDEKLGRDVVVKVLSPELSEGVSAGRFTREIRFAAALQEPHIVPVLSAGSTASGLPYYTMPLISGESLRARLQRGPVPLAEAVGILRDVATALEYAHAHGIVHRDIKPENVLLSGRTAVVTDFGIAKALHAAKTQAADGPADGRTLTQVGTSLGTPAYMAPEQAAGDPGTDERADIYAWGVMAYEMLAGRHPFAERLSAHQLVAAHMSEPPPPLVLQDDHAATRSRLTAPSALAELVMQCLTKDPAMRPRSAADLVASLDTARDEAVRAAGAPTGRMLARALALYAASFIAVALIARGAIAVVGLPDWVLPGAMVVMALGLPVLLLTGFVHHQAHREGATAPRSSGGSLAQRALRHLTWRRAATGGVTAVGAFVVIVATYMVLRVLGIGPAGSLLAAGVLEDREPVIVADFAVAGHDTALGPVVAEAVRANLGQSQAVAIMPASRVSAALARMQRPRTSRVDAALAREVALREGVRAIVGGELTPLGGGYLVTLRLISAEKGDALASFRETAEAPTDLIPALDRLTRDLRGRIGESFKDVRNDRRLAEVTTPSLDALRKYTAAVHAEGQGDNARSAALAREALAIDSTFAMAWRTLAHALTNARVTTPERDSAYARAYHHRGRLTEREALLATASYFTRVRRDLRQAAMAYDALLARDSTDDTAMNNYGGVLMGLHEFERAEAIYRRTAERNPRYVPYYNMTLAMRARGRIAAAESTATFILRRFPEADNAPLASIELALLRFDLDSADALAKQLSVTARAPAPRAAAMGLRLVIARMRGRLVEARRFAEETASLGAQAGAAPSTLVDSLDAVREDLWIRGQPARAIARLDGIVASPALASSLASEKRATFLAIAALYAAAGNVGRARSSYAAGTTGADSMQLRGQFPARMVAAGEIALAEGRPLDAMTAFAKSAQAADGTPESNCTVCRLPLLARAAENAGLADSSRVLWERFVNTPSISRHLTDQWFLPMAYRRLAAAHAAAGDSTKAAAYARRFALLWANADGEMQRQVAMGRR